MPEDAYQDPFSLKLSDSRLQDEVDAAICDMVVGTVYDCRDRDDDLKSYRLQLEGVSEPISRNEPWPGASDIEASISRELHTTTTAAMWSGARQTPHILVEAVLPEDMEQASKVESYLDIKAQQFGFDDSLRDAIYLANEGRYSALYVGYSPSEKIRHFSLKHDLDEEGNQVGDPRVEMRETDLLPRIEFRTPNPWDFYVYPPNAATPQVSEGASLGATAVMERMRLTEEDLLLGVLQEDYDEKAVLQMIESGAKELDIPDDDDERDGVKSVSARESTAWECFQVIGRMPLMPDSQGKHRIPDDLLHVDCTWMVCPSLRIVFKQAYSDLPESLRPYSIFNVVKKPNRMLGEGIVSMVSALHQEITANKRAFINNLNMETMPTLTATEAWLTRYSKWTLAPGRVLPRMAGDPTGPQPLKWDTSAQQLIPELLQMLDAEANRLAASQGVNSGMSGKVRKAAEIHFAEAMQQTKFDLFLSNIQRGVKETFRIMMLLLLHKMPDGGGEEVLSGNQIVSITSDDIRRTLRFIPQATTDSISPAQRLMRQETIKRYVTEYHMGKPQWMQLNCLHEMWHVYHRLCVLAGERSPERYLGPEPPKTEQALQMPGMGGMMPPTMPGSQNGQQPPVTRPLAAVGGVQGGGGMLQASPYGPSSKSNGV